MYTRLPTTQHTVALCDLPPTHCPQVTCKVEDSSDDEVTPDLPMSTTSTSSRCVVLIGWQCFLYVKSCWRLMRSRPEGCSNLRVAHEGARVYRSFRFVIACSRKVGAHIKSAVGTAAEKCAEK